MLPPETYCKRAEEATCKGSSFSPFSRLLEQVPALVAPAPARVCCGRGRKEGGTKYARAMIKISLLISHIRLTFINEARAEVKSGATGAGLFVGGGGGWEEGGREEIRYKFYLNQKKGFFRHERTKSSRMLIFC